MARGANNSGLLLFLVSLAVGYYFWKHPSTQAAPAASNSGGTAQQPGGVHLSPVIDYLPADILNQRRAVDPLAKQESIDQATALDTIAHPFGNDPRSVPGEYPGSDFVGGGTLGIPGVRIDPSNRFDTGFNPTGPLFPTPYLNYDGSIGFAFPQGSGGGGMHAGGRIPESL